MNYTLHIIIEGCVVGMATVILGTVISLIYAKLENNNHKFLNNIGMYICLFLTGFILHIGWDLVGLNKWYCKHCAGCK